MNYSENILTQDELKKLFAYDETTGDFTRIIDSYNYKFRAGTIAGHLKYNGYMYIKINKRVYPSHRLVWLYLYGKFPDNFIDHINGIKSDNRLENLRDANRSDNGKNRGLQSNNTSGCSGVIWYPNKNKWHSSITINCVRKSLGYFKEKSDAIKAYHDNAKEFFGEFYYYNKEIL